MEEWCAFLEKTYRPAHLSMHFDGVRVSLPDEVDATKVCKQSEEYIEERTGIKLCIQVKHHHYFLQLLAALGTQSSVDDVDDILLKDGNCIPAAIASMYPEQLDSMKKLVAGSDVTTRTYRECLSCTSLVAFPSAMLDNAPKRARLDPGRYLLHLENGHEPHCIAVVAEDKGEVYINDGGSCWQMKNEDMVELLQGAIDYKTMVIFELKNSESDEVVEVSRDRLLSLRAGGIKRKPVGLPSSSGMDCDDAAEDPALPAHDLIRCLTTEVDNYVSNGCPAPEDEGDAWVAKPRCGLCPFRRFAKRIRVVEHVDKYHVRESHSYCNSSKMMRIVHALWDDDAVQGRPHHPDYIQRAADCVRQWVKPPLHPTIMHDRLDRSMRLLLDINGPRYVSVDNIREMSLRCVGYTYLVVLHHGLCT